MSKVQFGKISTTKVEGGVTTHIETNMVDGKAVAPKEYAMRSASASVMRKRSRKSI